MNHSLLHFACTPIASTSAKHNQQKKNHVTLKRKKKTRKKEWASEKKADLFIIIAVAGECRVPSRGFCLLFILYADWIHEIWLWLGWKKKTTKQNTISNNKKITTTISVVEIHLCESQPSPSTIKITHPNTYRKKNHGKSIEAARWRWWRRQEWMNNVFTFRAYITTGKW